MTKSAPVSPLGAARSLMLCEKHAYHAAVLKKAPSERKRSSPGLLSDGEEPARSFSDLHHANCVSGQGEVNMSVNTVGNHAANKFSKQRAICCIAMYYVFHSERRVHAEYGYCPLRAGSKRRARSQ